ncbi:MAG: DUF6691 family protein [Burkholderiaceae bacterium]
MSAAFRLSPARLLAVLAAGALFGFGLSLSTMVQPEVVLGFLRFQDAGLMLVMGGAMGVTLVAYKLLPRVLKKPLLGGYFHWHVSHWNRDTLVGAAIFGIGWGLVGVPRTGHCRPRHRQLGPAVGVGRHRFGRWRPRPAGARAQAAGATVCREPLSA